jgi:CBS domain containing-hemolysin-like protein
MFQETRTHLAVVFKDDDEAADSVNVLAVGVNKRETVMGIITLEDIVECIIGEDICDETDEEDEKLLR